MAGSVRSLLAVLALFSFGVPRGAAAAPAWRSSLEGLTFVTIEKKVQVAGQPGCPACALTGSQALAHLPPEVLERTGPHAIEYEGFLTTWLPEPAARALAEVARGQGLAVGGVGGEALRVGEGR